MRRPVRTTRAGTRMNARKKLRNSIVRSGRSRGSVFRAQAAGRTSLVQVRCRSGKAIRRLRCTSSWCVLGFTRNAISGAGCLETIVTPLRRAGLGISSTFFKFREQLDRESRLGER